MSLIKNALTPSGKSLLALPGTASTAAAAAAAADLAFQKKKLDPE